MIGSIAGNSHNMVQYLGQRSPTEEIKVNPVPEPPTYFGPTSVTILRLAEGGVKYTVQCWMGGKGLAEDGQWGKTFALQFETLQTDKAAITAAVVLQKYRSAIEEGFGEEACDALIRAICYSLQFGPLADEWTAAELEEFYK